MNRPNVIVAMPTAESMYSAFVANLFTMLSATRTADVSTAFAIGSVIHTLRNALAGAALDAGTPTHLFFLDTDIVAPADVIDRLLSHDKDIVAGVYRQRKPPFDVLGQEEPGQTGDLRKMVRVPAGCLMVKLDVFRRLKQPWFEFGFRGSTEISEDYLFCENARAAGFDVWCDIPLSLSLAHMALTGIHTNREYK